jgi:hypothetical protein
MPSGRWGWQGYKLLLNGALARVLLLGRPGGMRLRAVDDTPEIYENDESDG